MQAAFESRRVLNCSRSELEQLLVAVAAEAPADAAGQARAREMGDTMRQLLVAKTPRGSKLAFAAAILALAALLCSAGHAYYSRAAYSTVTESAAEMGDYIRATSRDGDWTEDPRTQLTVEELARRAPSLRTGTLQAWWAGEEARRVQRLEALAKRQALAGDHDGAARSVKRADAIRSGLEPLARFEKPVQN